MLNERTVELNENRQGLDECRFELLQHETLSSEMRVEGAGLLERVSALETECKDLLVEAVRAENAKTTNISELHATVALMRKMSEQVARTTQQNIDLKIELSAARSERMIAGNSLNTQNLKFELAESEAMHQSGMESCRKLQAELQAQHPPLNTPGLPTMDFSTQPCGLTQP
eukprot:3980951-Amphidinium_carterae.1